LKILRGLIITLIVLIAVAVGALYATGNSSLLTFGWAFTFGGPSEPFDASATVAPPNYADKNNWAGLPDVDGVEDKTPQGISNLQAQGDAPVDVFFIHPTGYLPGNSWISNLDRDTATEENTQWMMANQASAYNGCCNVYAPRYRQANIFAYFKGDEVRETVLGFAYTDVKRAFDYFITNFNKGRPFIVASHSQGTHHGVRLLAEEIDGTERADRMVAAYLIGGNVKTSAFDSMASIDLCTTPTDLRCAVHWDTWSEAVIDREMPDVAGNVCTNPLSWQLNDNRVDAAAHAGAVPASGEFQMALSGDDKATGVVFGPLGEPIPNMLSAQCKGGALYVTDQSDNRFGEVGGSFGGGNYHGLDYPLFYMDIRRNAILRTQTYLEIRSDI